jgi:hypothetical protein
MRFHQRDMDDFLRLVLCCQSTGGSVEVAQNTIHPGPESLYPLLFLELFTFSKTRILVPFPSRNGIIPVTIYISADREAFVCSSE